MPPPSCCELVGAMRVPPPPCCGCCLVVLQVGRGDEGAAAVVLRAGRGNMGAATAVLRAGRGDEGAAAAVLKDTFCNRDVRWFGGLERAPRSECGRVVHVRWFARARADPQIRVRA